MPSLIKGDHITVTVHLDRREEHFLTLDRIENSNNWDWDLDNVEYGTIYHHGNDILDLVGRILYGRDMHRQNTA